MSATEHGRRAVVVVLGVVALAIITVLAIALERGPIARDLTRRSEAALTAVGINGVDVDFEGRDGTLRGMVASEAEVRAAREIVDDLTGVRVVDGLLTVAPPTTTTTTTAPAATEASFSLAVSGGTAVLEGTVPSPADATAIEDVARAVFGAVDSRLVVDAASAAPPWLPGLPGAIGGLRGVGGATLEPAGADVSVSGSVATRLINATPGARIEISGHTDDVGDDASNLALSQARADAVAAYLIDAGVDPVQVNAVGHGETRAVADNTTEEGRSANRRIEFDVEGAA